MTVDGTTYTYKQQNGAVYNVSSGQPELVESPLSASELAQRAAKNGATVSILSPLQMKKRDEEEKKRLQKRRESGIDYELGLGVPWGNAEYRKTARRNRLATRAMKRK